MLPPPILFRGVPGSPYTRKMRAVLRYRRIPNRLIISGSPEDHGLPEPRVRLLPTFFLPGDDGALVAVTDSTPLIRRLERDFEGRAVVPPDPVVAFVDELIEDYADEWLTKCMFHYRWAHDADVRKAAQLLPRWARTDTPEADVQKLAELIAGRQVGRLWVVGSNETTAPVIEASYRRFLRLFDAHLREHPFLMGRRPGASDFAVLGQLTQLVLFDPTPAAVALEESHRVYAWVERTEDLSGAEPAADDWTGREVPETLRALLGEVGRVYAPFMLDNAAAIERGAERVEAVVDGEPWVQRPFPYQAKCLRWLRQSYRALEAPSRAAVDAILAGTGCEALFEADDG